MIEELHMSSGREHYELKMAVLNLSDDVNQFKAAKRDVITTARRQIGVVAFRMFVILGFLSYCTSDFYIKNLIKDSVRAEVAEYNKSPPSTSTTPSPPSSPSPPTTSTALPSSV